MTKDKAIENIKLLMEIDSYPKDFADALLMAIEALQGDMYCPNCGADMRKGKE